MDLESGDKNVSHDWGTKKQWGILPYCNLYIEREKGWDANPWFGTNFVLANLVNPGYIRVNYDQTKCIGIPNVCGTQP